MINYKKFASILMLSASLYAAEYTAEWNYTNKGPSRWHFLHPEWETCFLGKEQSPINISSLRAIDKINSLILRYESDSKNVVNNGHTLQLNFDNMSYITFNDTKYNLLQAHFHTPSEHHLDGVIYPLEGHLVHQNENGDLLVIGVFFKKGKQNPIIKSMLANYSTEINNQMPLEKLNAKMLLPTKYRFYSLKGSLTTPPCTENVQWIILDNPATASAEQIKKLRELFHNNNTRTLQDSNNREITFTK